MRISQTRMSGNFHGDAHTFTEKGDIFIHMETEHKNISMQKVRFRKIEDDLRTKLEFKPTELRFCLVGMAGGSVIRILGCQLHIPPGH